MRNAGLDEALAGIKIARRNINKHPYGRKQRGTKEPLDEGWKRDEKVSLKFVIQKTKIMASGPITSWQIDGETLEIVTVFSFLGSKIMWTVTAAVKLVDACSLEEKLWQN